LSMSNPPDDLEPARAAGGRVRYGKASSRTSAGRVAAQEGMNAMRAMQPHTCGYADSSEGLSVYYEVYGNGEPIVVLAGGLGDTSSMMQVIGPLSGHRQVIGVDLEGHGHTALRSSPLSHERDGDDVAAVLRHLEIAEADVAGYSHGGDAAIRMAIQHPELVRHLIVLSTAAARQGWYPEALEGMDAVSASSAAALRPTPLYERYVSVAPHPEQFGLLLDRMGELMRKDYDWRPEIAKLRMPTLLVFADHDAISMTHIAEFFALFGGGVRDAGWGDEPRYARARLAIVPGYTHYNFGQGGDMARVIEAYLTQPTSAATQFSP
jgi:pimeloyl-ACP methyl ester carboxylesterase